MNEYTLIYPDGTAHKIKINKELSVGEKILFQNDLRSGPLTITEVIHTFAEQSFDRSITHDVGTIVQLGYPSGTSPNYSSPHNH